MVLFENFLTVNIFVFKIMYRIIELDFIRQEMGWLKDENHKQNLEMAKMMETITSQNITITQHEVMIKELANQQKLSSRRRGNKRPARLLPAHILRGGKNKTIKQTDQRKFYGPPSNCSDLSQLGYTLNGYYLVNTTDALQSKQLVTIYCAFKRSEGILFNPSGIEKRIGHLKLNTDNDSNKKAGGVHFEVASSSQIFGTALKRIPFDKVALNEGGAFNLNARMFTAPKYGIYRFFFKGKILLPSAAQNQRKIYIDVQLHVNDFNRQLMPNYYDGDGGVMFEKLLKLHKGDQVIVGFSLSANSSEDIPSMTQHSYFIGSLLEELKF